MAVPRIWLTFAVSVLVHVAALWVVLPRLPLLSPGEEQGQASDRLQVRVAALPPPAPAQPPPPKLPTPKPETRAIVSSRPRARDARAPEARPRLVAPSPEAPQVPEVPVPPTPPVVAEPTPPKPPVTGDLSSFIAARRRARGDADAPAESDIQRRDSIVASNMPSATGALASRMKRGGGLFEITRMTYDDAQFLFFGWNKDAGRRTPQAYEVRLGSNSDMRIAVVRRMIAIIREQEHGDFSWQSWRLDRVVVLSARPEDNAGLEEFLMHEMFDEAPRTPSR